MRFFYEKRGRINWRAMRYISAVKVVLSFLGAITFCSFT
jgi:hypothetical protein